MARIRWVGFDGDDTLWKSEDYYRQAEADFEAILGTYVDLADARTHQHLLDVERRNLKIFGYGVKGMTLSMLETAIQLTDERISARDLHRVIEIGRTTLLHPVDLLPGIREAVERNVANHEIVRSVLDAVQIPVERVVAVDMLDAGDVAIYYQP